MNKPSGMACHRSPMVRQGPYVLQRARRLFRKSVYLPHRLDRAASGCLLIAFSSEWAGILNAALHHPTTEKTYVCFVRGFFRHDGVVDVNTPISDTSGVAKPSHSRVEVLGRSHTPRCSLLRVQTTTGRYHQVRRHVRDLDHPILGDTSHGDYRENRMWKQEWGLQRLGLHCLRLDLPLPEGGRLRATSPIPNDLTAVLSRLPWWKDVVQNEPDLLLANHTEEESTGSPSKK